MPTIAVCSKCGGSVAANDAGGICPRCLIGLGMRETGDPTLAAQMPFPVPPVEELVGKFPNLQIEHFIGHGGMGAVYQARQIALDRPVALKILSPRLGSDPTFTERFAREARTLAKLAHPNIVMVFEHGQTENMNYLVMEFVDGINLRDAISEGKLSSQEALAIVPQICDALQYAHDEGVIHRDIKPENILIDKKGRVKIADFGLAKLLEPGGTEFTLTGTQQVMGTRNYMAPEQIEFPDVVDHRADLYSLGVVFYELLTGELPLGRFSLPSEKASVSNRLDDIVLRTLEKEPGKRFQQASEIKTAVDNVASATAAAEPVNQQFHQQSQPHHGFQPNPGRPNRSFNQNVRCTLPFSISEIYGGLACAYGIAHLGENGIELEYEVQDEVFGNIKSGAKRVRVPNANIISIEFVKGIFNDRIEVQTDRLDITNEVPNSKQGRFQLGTKRADIDRAKRFAAEAEQLAGTPGVFAKQPAPPVKTEMHAAVHPPHVSNAEAEDPLKGPRVGYTVAAWINLVSAVIGLLRSASWKPLSELQDKIEWFPDIPVAYFTIPQISFASLITLAFAIWMFILAGKIRRRADYYFVLTSAILLLMLAAHPTYILALIFSIWTLIVIGDPKVKSSFNSESQFVHVYTVGVGPKTQASIVGFARTLMMFFLVLISCLGSVLVLYLIFSFAAREKGAPAEKEEVKTVEAVSVDSDEASAAAIATTGENRSAELQSAEPAEEKSPKSEATEEESSASASSTATSEPEDDGN